MLNKTICIFFLFCIAASLALFGCAPITGESTVWIDDGVSFADYQAFEIHPVSNVTGKTFNINISSILTEYLKEQLEDKYLPINYFSKSKRGILTVRSEILVYEPYVGWPFWSQPTEKPVCVVRTRLTDETKSPLRVVAQINTVVVAGNLGYYFSIDQEVFLQETAIEIAKEAVKIMQPIELK
jgi:hypothetical protein